MLVRCVRRFRDLEAGTIREGGATFEATKERVDAINSTRYGHLVEIVEEQPTETVSEPQGGTSEEPAPKRRRGRPRKAETQE